MRYELDGVYDDIFNACGTRCNINMDSIYREKAGVNHFPFLHRENKTTSF